LALLKRALDDRDDDNLRVLDYELQDAQISGTRATVVSKMSWHRLPSITARSQGVTTVWESRDGVWFVVSIDGGPLPLEELTKKAAAP
jgi:hypothetical protein